MELWLDIDGETQDFDVTRDGDEILVTRDGMTRRVAVETSGATYRVTVDGKGFELTRDGEEPRGLHGEVLSLERGGATSAVKWESRKGSLAQSVGDDTGGDGGVFPLMPGAIMEIQVAAGDTVDEGDVRLVLEAMKMQNEVTAPVAGTVAEINVQTGDNVDRRTMMVRIDPEAPGGS